MAIHKPNNDDSTKKIYEELHLSGEPFKKVHYYAPRDRDGKITSYLPQNNVEEYFSSGLLKRFTYVYENDRESLEMLFAEY